MDRKIEKKIALERNERMKKKPNGKERRNESKDGKKRKFTFCQSN